jgi:hypothetical protein
MRTDLFILFLSFFTFVVGIHSSHSLSKESREIDALGTFDDASGALIEKTYGHPKTPTRNPPLPRKQRSPGMYLDISLGGDSDASRISPKNMQSPAVLGSTFYLFDWAFGLFKLIFVKILTILLSILFIYNIFFDEGLFQSIGRDVIGWFVFVLTGFTCVWQLVDPPVLLKLPLLRHNLNPITAHYIPTVVPRLARDCMCQQRVLFIFEIIGQSSFLFNLKIFMQMQIKQILLYFLYSFCIMYHGYMEATTSFFVNRYIFISFSSVFFLGFAVASYNLTHEWCSRDRKPSFPRRLNFDHPDWECITIFSDVPVKDPGYKQQIFSLNFFTFSFSLIFLVVFRLASIGWSVERFYRSFDSIYTNFYFIGILFCIKAIIFIFGLKIESFFNALVNHQTSSSPSAQFYTTFSMDGLNYILDIIIMCQIYCDCTQTIHQRNLLSGF